jgi:NAD(P)-dependent dehydrogenase (short-subunit alcohol dehydrogenase family)
VLQAETRTKDKETVPRELGDVIVTGAASGLGLAIAERIATEGGRPISFDLKEAANIESEVVDLSDTRSAERAVRECAERLGGLDAVVAAAGTDSCGPMDQVPAAEWERVVTVNLLGTAAVVRAALPELRRSRGRVVTVASTLGLRALPDATAYCASKFGVVGMTRALSAETAGEIGVTLLMPGGMDTHFFDGREEKYQPPPDAGLAPPEEVAEAVIFALRRPPSVEVREMLVCPPTESSWP